MSKPSFSFAKNEEAIILHNILKEEINTTWNLSSIQKAISKKEILNVYKDSQIIGLIHFSEILDEIEIFNIAIDHNFQKLGLGSLLIKHLFGLYPQHKYFLEVRTSNTKAISFYQKHGFLNINTRKKYYNDGEDALVMQKK